MALGAMSSPMGIVAAVKTDLAWRGGNDLLESAAGNNVLAGGAYDDHLFATDPIAILATETQAVPADGATGFPATTVSSSRASMRSPVVRGIVDARIAA